jgi:hypothetical protein
MSICLDEAHEWARCVDDGEEVRLGGHIDAHAEVCLLAFHDLEQVSGSRVRVSRRALSVGLPVSHGRRKKWEKWRALVRAARSSLCLDLVHVCRS